MCHAVHVDYTLPLDVRDNDSPVNKYTGMQLLCCNYKYLYNMVQHCELQDAELSNVLS